MNLSKIEVRIKTLLESGNIEKQKEALRLCNESDLSNSFIDEILFPNYKLCAELNVEIVKIEKRVNEILKEEYIWFNFEDVIEFPPDGVFDVHLPIIPSIIGKFKNLKRIYLLDIL